jgi:hypothetical protein
MTREGGALNFSSSKSKLADAFIVLGYQSVLLNKFIGRTLRKGEPEARVATSVTRPLSVALKTRLSVPLN